MYLKETRYNSVSDYLVILKVSQKMSGKIMNFLKNIFSTSSKPEVEIKKGLDVYRQYLDTLSIAALLLLQSNHKTLSKIGGIPGLPEGIEWPMWKDEPLAFLCQIELSEIPDSFYRDDLPNTGVIYFFYDQKIRTWGYDPQDKGSWRVVYSHTSSAENSLRNIPEKLQKKSIYNEKFITYELMSSYPDIDDDRIESLELSEWQRGEYFDFRHGEHAEELPRHQLLGYPDAVQDADMNLQCQLVFNGIDCGDSICYNDPKAKALEVGKDDWILLLQLDSDQEANMVWVDGGKLYFWIRKDDLRNCNFENTWMILQTT